MFTLGTRLGAAALTLSALFVPSLAQAATPVGEWALSSGESRFEISACGPDTLCARLTWLSADAREDEELSALLGSYVMQGAIPAGPNAWAGTVTFDGDTYAGRLTMVDPDTIRLRGCLGIFCRTMELERV